MSGEKFRWFEAMYHDARIPLGQRAIVGYCGIRYAMESEGYLVKIRQQTVADHLGVHVNTVAAAFKSAQRRGWMRMVGERQRGRGHHEPDTWELTTPTEIPTPSSGYSGEKYPHETAEIPTNDDPWGPKYPQETAEIPTTCEPENPYLPAVSATLQGLDTGISKYNRDLLSGTAHAAACTPHDETNIHAQALDITDSWVRGMNRRGGAKTVIVNAVMASLRSGLDEDAVAEVIQRWQKKELYPSANTLAKMLAQARAHVDTEMVDRAESRERT
jgi:hypothetical protein